ncbi:hypothetical protein NCU84_12695 [Acinetobacter baumannii]|uniref:Uncharacterized protein n=2 Tax=Acinetobacter baumannii (strain ATCC 19606 / DSM 30007 / JCM 6841 / CCUG 19606 / CIP 70.34 / NBRC 109757 / NCIMB 12457 / NCTC 12156 / 81) TaxID=575584 RepID=A0ABX6CEE0_ACIB2|nr:hypothetical protein [Acinetobacter baumannii]ARN31401.1 hypothetical protein A4U85_11840 [Acinetobacter baumannii]EEX01819.1 hypothetical protein HMPREF0010_03598 [Acinetobacter baumannii ATCC 19606 = CIP 70.34 = JCM 6841]EME54738.1 hypothetical protein G347_12763 [Acinetobacter baumannii MSP4-16]ENW72437.1 hypothetical protein F911_03850 [Acinetobacter baumannii ATCC 19606 = CIP 70.34 = JCM 6841]KFC03303.1 hypothetical protein DJ41_2212 [Acinetobacter baumannii ATCC 19606 = CIP 70.34 = JC
MNNNPETIEINGLKTIHKLCEFAVNHNMEGCSFTEIVERMFSELEETTKKLVMKASRVELTCEQLYAAANFGSPDNDPDLIDTEVTIAWFESGHSGSGYYAYISEYPEEGAIKLESKLGAEQP